MCLLAAGSWTGQSAACLPACSGRIEFHHGIGLFMVWGMLVWRAVAVLVLVLCMGLSAEPLLIRMCC